LAEALKKFYAVSETPEPDVKQKPLFAPVPLEEYSYNIQLDGRVERLEQESQRNSSSRWFLLTIVFLIVACINYFVV